MYWLHGKIQLPLCPTVPPDRRQRHEATTFHAPPDFSLTNKLLFGRQVSRAPVDEEARPWGRRLSRSRRWKPCRCPYEASQ